MADAFPTAGASEEQCTHGCGFHGNKKICDRRTKLDDAIPSMALQTISDALSIVPGAGHIYQIAEATVTELESVLVVPINSEPSQGSNNGDSGINVDQAAGENVPAHEIAMPLIARAIMIVGLLTVIADGRTALFKPASGAVFAHNKLAYYVTLAVILALGITELFIGFWIYIYGLTYRRSLWIGGVVLFLSVWPFVCILGMGGFA